MDAQISELARDIDEACRLSGEFTLRTGLISSEYFDKYRFETKPELLRRVAEAMVPLLPTDTEALGALELGGVPIATMVSSLTDYRHFSSGKKPSHTAREGSQRVTMWPVFRSP